MNDVESRVISLIARQLKKDVSEIDGNKRFSADLSADSLDQVEIVMALEEEFNIEISEEAASKIVTVNDAINYIQNEIKKAA